MISDKEIEQLKKTSYIYIVFNGQNEIEWLCELLEEAELVKVGLDCRLATEESTWRIVKINKRDIINTVKLID